MNMSVRKALTIMLSGLCLSFSPAGFADDPQRGKGNAQAPTQAGVINYIDPAKSRIVISDMVFGYSALTLKVHEGGRTSSVNSLKADQKIRFAYDLRRLGSTLGEPRVVTDIWIERD